MPTLDAQVHAYERNHPGRPWVGTLYGPAEVTGDQMVAAMDAVGVDGAMLVSPFSMYRYDASYALEVYAAHPDRFRLVKPVDPTDPAVVETIADWAGAQGHGRHSHLLERQRLNRPRRPRHQPCPGHRGAALLAGQPGVYRAPRAGRAAGGAKSQHAAGDRPSRAAAAARAATPAEPFADLPKLLALAAHDNIAVKISGACTLSHEPFPYNDIWDPLGRVFDAFGFDRCMWGTDWTRAVGMLTYEQGVEAFRVTDRLSDSERAALMGETLARIYNWSSAQA